MNKKELSKLAKKAANVRWKGENQKKAYKIANELTMMRLTTPTNHGHMIDLMEYLISKYRITKR